MNFHHAKRRRGETEVVFQTFHSGQVKLFEAFLENRFLAARCGRRFGKTDFDVIVGGMKALEGKFVGFFAPDYKILKETYYQLAQVLAPVIAQGTSENAGVIRTRTGGRIDFWSLENDRAGRSRKYDLVIIDEGAFTKNNMIDIWEKSIRPTLLDTVGKALVTSNTNGSDPENFMWLICNNPKYGFAQYHAPTHDNPFLPREEIAKLQAENHPLVYQQEYLAEFVDWSGVAFFSLPNLLENDQPVAVPSICDAVFATIDTAVKTGKDNDATACIYWAFNKYVPQSPLIILGYELLQIEGASLEDWLPNVEVNLEAYAEQCNARFGNMGSFIEDKASGMVLIQQAQRRGLKAHAIDSKLTALGKSERALSVSGYVFRGMVKISQPAFDYQLQYKKAHRNHLLGQVLGFRVGDKDPNAQDDLLDCFTYGIAIALGDSGGF